MGTKSYVNGFLLIFVILYLLLVISVFAAPEGPSSITPVQNTTKSTTSSVIYNTTNSGGYIHVINLTAAQANTRWKGFVGNVTGKLVLDSSAGSTLYDWSLSASLSGEVYATRTSAAIVWANINCTYFWTNGSLSENRSVEVNESLALGGFTTDDNLSATFNVQNHSAMTIGTYVVQANTCWATNSYINNASNRTAFDELLLYDNVSVVYATFIEQDNVGFDTRTYDFEMIVPQGNQTGSIAYYFYVEVI
ncbi:hypothetical protein HY501_02555 [Candidatus Woesearchaeota archaeon]|nr:hypothetical protein [Candidatus Woesearchaeota archaeon]